MNIDFFRATVARCPDVNKLWTHLTGALNALGYNRAVFSLMTRHNYIGANAKHAVFSSYGKPWDNYYDAMGYVHHDPVRNFLVKPARPFPWAATVPYAAHIPLAMKCMQDAACAGLHNGLAVPLFGPEGAVAGIGAARPSGSLAPSEDELSISSVLGVIFYHRFIDLKKRERVSIIRTVPLIELPDEPREET